MNTLHKALQPHVPKANRGPQKTRLLHPPHTCPLFSSDSIALVPQHNA